MIRVREFKESLVVALGFGPYENVGRSLVSPSFWRAGSREERRGRRDGPPLQNLGR